MTLLGGVAYAGFFGLAAVWLAMTGERDDPSGPAGPGQLQAAERSNAASAAADSVGSIPC